MSKEAAYRSRERILMLLLMLVEQPKMYTKQQLADKLGVIKDTIKGDLKIIEQVGFLLDHDAKYRQFLLENKPYLQLQSLLHFAEEDQLLLEQAIDQVSPQTKRGADLKKKLASLYDYRKLGHAYLRKPYLNKVDKLLNAKNRKQVVVLKDYRSSNSSEVSDRVVEPFHPSPPDDMLHAFDVDKKALRHFRISRIKRVEILDQSWAYEGHHLIRPTDAFRIVNKHQEMIHLRMGVGAYNELVERYPMTRAYLIESEEADMYDLQCMVNANFYGVTNFILGNYNFDIEVLAPDSLIKHLRKTVAEMRF